MFTIIIGIKYLLLYLFISGFSVVNLLSVFCDNIKSAVLKYCLGL